MHPQAHKRPLGAENLGGVSDVSSISVFAWILIWAVSMVALLYVYVHAGPWLVERKELKKLRVWIHHFEREKDVET